MQPAREQPRVAFGDDEDSGWFRPVNPVAKTIAATRVSTLISGRHVETRSWKPNRKRPSDSGSNVCPASHEVVIDRSELN